MKSKIYIPISEKKDIIETICVECREIPYNPIGKKRLIIKKRAFIDIKI